MQKAHCELLTLAFVDKGLGSFPYQQPQAQN